MMRVFFFFQAEDGIRDIGVTGVQTCALPICGGARSRPKRRGRWRGGDLTVDRAATRRLAQQLRQTAHGAEEPAHLRGEEEERKSVLYGKRVGLGRRRLLKKKLYFITFAIPRY